LKSLRERGLLSLQDLTSASGLRENRVEYGRVIEVKHALLGKAGRAFLTDRARTGRDSFDIFCEQSADWLDDYALFMACKSTCKDASWADWDVGIRQRDSPSLKEWREKLAPRIDIHKFVQFEFFRQWEKLKADCRARGISIMGDVPIYVAHDSADVESSRVVPFGRAL
jgi:4-alpha-glucanotransferase